MCVCMYVYVCACVLYCILISAEYSPGEYNCELASPGLIPLVSPSSLPKWLSHIPMQASSKTVSENTYYSEF